MIYPRLVNRGWQYIFLKDQLLYQLRYVICLVYDSFQFDSNDTDTRESVLNQSSKMMINL